jgi:glycosyltransferase involved in cell wall biosynthesis
VSDWREQVPWSVRAPVRRARNAVASGVLAVREAPRRRSIAAAAPRTDGPAVFYGVDRMPGPDEVVIGGAVKFQLLAESLPNAPRDFNVLYLGSSSMPLDAPALVRLARRRGASFVWNQNGVAYPGWYGGGYELVNRPRARLLHEADHVVFQTGFCKLGADRYYGEREGSWEILPNPVDTARFAPAPERPRRPLTLLLGGSQYQGYKLEAAFGALAELRRERGDARLLVAGELSFAPDAPEQAAARARRLGVEDAVELLGPYTQAEAPALMRRADLLLHPKYNDPCPTVVLEAMASGLPVAYSASGGVPELVGDEAGVGVPAPLDWERDHPPAADELAAAVLEVADRLDERAEAARRRAVTRFDARAWVGRHRAVFEELVRR